MFKKRYISVHSDFKTGLFYKISLILGLILLIIFIIIKVTSFIVGSDSTGFAGDIYNFSQTPYINTIFAFSILLFAAAVILYFFNCQFAKLSKIAEELENEENLVD
jgi:amino acid transporter